MNQDTTQRYSADWKTTIECNRSNNGLQDSLQAIPSGDETYIQNAERWVNSPKSRWSYRNVPSDQVINRQVYECKLYKVHATKGSRLP